MSSHQSDRHLTAAISLWEYLAAFAWEQFSTNGRGVILLEEREMAETLKRMNAGTLKTTTDLSAGYVCVRDVPPSDDFAPILAEYDPTRQIALLVRSEEGEERLYVLETSERHGRPTPRECFEAHRDDRR